MIVALALVGIPLSLYALWVKAKSHVKGYKPLCDVSKRISCTKAFTSRYSGILFINNAWVGLAYYVAVLALVQTGAAQLLLPLTTLGLAASLMLAYLSYVRMQNFCLVCTATYLVNIALFISTL